MSLLSIQANESYAAGVSWQAQRKPLKDEQRTALPSVAERAEIVFELLKADQSVDPKPGDQITDANSVVWHVIHQDAKVTGWVFLCYCLRNR